MSEADVLTQAKDVGGPQQPLLEVRHMSKHFPVRGGFIGKAGVVRAVDDVSFSVAKGEVLGIVGESGCGKWASTPRTSPTAIRTSSRAGNANASISRARSRSVRGLCCSMKPYRRSTSRSR